MYYMVVAVSIGMLNSGEIRGTSMISFVKGKTEISLDLPD